MRKKLGELLVEAGAATADDIAQALAKQRAAPNDPKEAKPRLGELLVRAGTVTHRQVGLALAMQWDLPFVELSEIPGEVSRLVPVEVQAAHGIVPFRLEQEGKTERVHVAIADPRQLDHVEELRFQLGKQVRLFIAAQDDLDDVLSALKGDVSEEFEINEEEDLVVVGISEDEAPESWIATSPETATSGGAGSRLPVAKELDDLLGKLEPAASPIPAQKVEVIRFPPQRTATPPAPLAAVPPPLPSPPPPLPPPASLEGISDDDLKILESLERMAAGEAPVLESEKVRPAQMVAALIRLLIRKNVIGEADFLEELGRK